MDSITLSVAVSLATCLVTLGLFAVGYRLIKGEWPS